MEDPVLTQKVLLLAWVALVLISCQQPDSLTTVLINGVAAERATAAVAVYEGDPSAGSPASTEFNLAAWREGAGEEEFLTFRVYNGLDFRDELLEGGVVAGDVEDVYRVAGSDENAYVAENGAEGSYFGTGTYTLEFAEEHVRGSFDVVLTTFADVNGNQLDFERREIGATFDLPLDLGCWVRGGVDNRTITPDTDYSSEFCKPFKAWSSEPM